MEAHDVVVVGGGVTGLAAAYRLTHRLPSATIALFEAAGRLGGKIVTERRDGFVVEGGPDCFLSSKPWALDLCADLGLEGSIVPTERATRRTFVVRRGRLRRLPEGMSGLVPSRLASILSSDLLPPWGRVRLALEYLVPRRRTDTDETVERFASRRFGADVFRWLIDPLLGGVYAGDASALSLRATFPQLHEMESRYGSVLRGLARREPAPGAAPPFITLRHGMSELIDTLASRLTAVRVATGTRVVRVSSGNGGFAVELDGGTVHRARAVVLATPAFVAADLVSRLDQPLAAVLRAIPFVSTATVALAFRTESLTRPLDGHGYLRPRAEGDGVSACTWVSSKFPHRAPAGHALIRLFVGRAGDEALATLADEPLVELARDELRRTLGVTAPPDAHWIHRWPQGMPQYTTGHVERLEDIAGRLAGHPGLVLAGHSYRGVGIPDCVRSAYEAAEAAAQAVARRAA